MAPVPRMEVAGEPPSAQARPVLPTSLHGKRLHHIHATFGAGTEASQLARVVTTMMSLKEASDPFGLVSLALAGQIVTR